MSGKQLFSGLVNGEPHELAVAPSLTLLELLRDELGLTGTKRGCDDGSCGACTVLVDGEPVLSCLQLALLVEDREVTSIEAVANDGQLSALQEALVCEGGLQCGFCTPGMVLAAHAVVHRERDDAAPTRQEVARAMSNNLCRCTGYERIVNAALESAASPSAGEAAVKSGTTRCESSRKEG